MSKCVILRHLSVKFNFSSNVSPYTFSPYENSAHCLKYISILGKKNKVFCRHLIVSILLSKHSSNKKKIVDNSFISKICLYGKPSRSSHITLMRAPYRYKVAKLSLRLSRYKFCSHITYNPLCKKVLISNLLPLVNLTSSHSLFVSSSLAKLSSFEIKCSCKSHFNAFLHDIHMAYT